MLSSIVFGIVIGAFLGAIFIGLFPFYIVGFAKIIFYKILEKNNQQLSRFFCIITSVGMFTTWSYLLLAFMSLLMNIFLELIHNTPIAQISDITSVCNKIVLISGIYTSYKITVAWYYMAYFSNRDYYR